MNRDMRSTVVDASSGQVASLEGWGSKTPLAVLASPHSDTILWGKRWLERFGFRVALATSLEEATRLLAVGDAEIVVSEGSLRGVEGAALGAVRGQRDEGEEIPRLALCATPKEARVALQQNCADVACRPFEWPLIGHRATRLVHAHRTSKELICARADLSSLESERARPDSGSGFLDPLTGLPRRKPFERSLASALASSARTGGGLAVMLLDLDRFKLINETCGRHRGNEVLRQVSERLTSALRGTPLARRTAGPSTAAVARLDGDAFAMMVSPIGDRDEVAQIGQGVIDALSRPLMVEGAELYVSGSLGTAIAPADGRSPEDLLHRAELAMDEARRRGGGLCRPYHSELTRDRERALMIDRLLRRTLEREELRLHYQPIIDARTRRIVGAEALLRWHHPELGEVPPLEFIPIAEESGFMVEIGGWVLKTACRQLQDWMAAGLGPIRMAVNMSLCQLMRGDLCAAVDEALCEAGIDPALLEIELSERGVLKGDPDVLRQLHALRDRGVRLSVDDFGTGDSAIAYLKRFPLDTLKVDRSFVAGALLNPDDGVIMSAMIAMAHSLHLRVVAEGVEEPEQVSMLEGLACEELQGFFFSKGVSAGEFREMLAGEKGALAATAHGTSAERNDGHGHD